MTAPFADVSPLCMAAKHVPERTPKMHLISTLASDCTEDKSDKVKTQYVGGSRRDTNASLRVYDTSALKQLTLLPPVKECCGAATIVPSFLLVYTTVTFVAAALSAECTHCLNTILASMRRRHRRTNEGQSQGCNLSSRF